MLASAVRFLEFENPQLCPRPDSKNMKADDYAKSKGVLDYKYSTSLHYAIALLRRVDGALPAHSSGKKALDFARHTQSKQVLLCAVLTFCPSSLALHSLLQRQILPPQGPASVRLVVLLHVDSRCWASAESCSLKAQCQDSS